MHFWHNIKKVSVSERGVLFFFFPVLKKRIFETERLIPTCVNPVQSLGCVFWSSFNFPYKQMTETEYI